MTRPKTKLIWIVAAQMLAALFLNDIAKAAPLFQFQAFYYQDPLEISPGANMTITGPVAANLDIYLDPQASLTFLSTVTAGGGVFESENPLDPSSRTFGSVTFDIPPVSNAPAYILLSASNGYAPLQIPPTGESPTSPATPAYLYNYADMIVIISNNNTVTVTSGVLANGRATFISQNQWQIFLSTNGTFYDQRDGLTVNPVVLNVSNLVSWSATNTVLRPILANERGPAANVDSIYVDDQRSTTSNIVITVYSYTTNYSTNTTTTLNYPVAGTYVPPVTTNTTITTTHSYPSPGTYVGSITTNGIGGFRTYTYNLITGYSYQVISDMISTNSSYVTNSVIVSQPGIVLSNGAVLPPQGLSIATPDPAYIIGNWNVQLTANGPSDAGTSSTASSLPSAIFADAITALSPAWNPANSAMGLQDRTATSDTVNAAFYSGDVPSNGEYYSGGLENFMRLLENWSGSTLTWNGSICCMFASQIANAPWPGTGTVYSPPIRNWAFDTNFSDPATLPPMTPFIYQESPVTLNIAETNGTIQLSWNAQLGIGYALQYTTDLSQGNWQAIANTNYYGSCGPVTLSYPIPNTQQFYRLQIVP